MLKMAEAALIQLSEPRQGLESRDSDAVQGKETQQESSSGSTTETSSMNDENETTEKKISTTHPTRPKLREKANSYFAERKGGPVTRRWMSLMYRNLAANPGSNEHEVSDWNGGVTGKE